MAGPLGERDWCAAAAGTCMGAAADPTDHGGFRPTVRVAAIGADPRYSVEVRCNTQPPSALSGPRGCEGAGRRCGVRVTEHPRIRNPPVAAPLEMALCRASRLVRVAGAASRVAVRTSCMSEPRVPGLGPGPGSGSRLCHTASSPAHFPPGPADGGPRHPRSLYRPSLAQCRCARAHDSPPRGGRAAGDHLPPTRPLTGTPAGSGGNAARMPSLAGPIAGPGAPESHVLERFAARRTGCPRRRAQ